MKRCPTCSRVYDDTSLRFCFDDGTELVNKVPEGGPAQTLVMPATSEAQSTIHAAPPLVTPSASVIPATQAAKHRAVWPWILAGGALFLLVAVAVVVVIVRAFPRTPLVDHLVLQPARETANRDATASLAVAVIKNRLNALGLSRFEVKVGAPGSGQILVNLPALENPVRVKQIISTWGKLEFAHVVSPASPAPAQTFDTEAEANTSLQKDRTTNGRVLPYAEQTEPSSAPRPKKWVIVEVPAIVDGFDLRNAVAARSPVGDDYEIRFSLKKDGADKFALWTGSHINQYIAIVLNDEVKSIAFIKSQISDQGEINGRYTKQSAEDLALVLNAGALPVPLQFVEEKVDPH